MLEERERKYWNNDSEKRFKSVSLLEKWTDLSNCKKWRNKHPREQACLDDILKKDKLNRVQMMECCSFNRIDGDFMNLSEEERCYILEKYKRIFFNS